MTNLIEFFDEDVRGRRRVLTYDDGFRPVVPVRIDGADSVLHHTWRWPRRGTITVRIGEPILLEGDDCGALAQRVQDAVVHLGPAPPGQRVESAALRPTARTA